MNTLASNVTRNLGTGQSATPQLAENTRKGTAHNWLLAIAALLVVSLMSSGFAQAQTDPFVGIWKLDIAKSTPKRKSETRIVESSPTGLKVAINRTNADGSNQQYSYTANFDGKFYPFTGNPPYGADSIAVTLGAYNTLTFKLSRGGNVIGSGTLVVSADGKTATLKSSGTDEKGAKLSSVSIYTKQ
jgi:hypothetical protein